MQMEIMMSDQNVKILDVLREECYRASHLKHTKKRRLARSLNKKAMHSQGQVKSFHRPWACPAFGAECHRCGQMNRYFAVYTVVVAEVGTELDCGQVAFGDAVF